MLNVPHQICEASFCKHITKN